MSIPFQFALTNTNLYGILWNPWAASEPSGSVANAILAALDADERRAMDITIPEGRVRVVSYNIQSDAADAKLMLGYYDVTLSAFVDVAPVFATVVAAGGLVRKFETNIMLPCSATKIPVIKYTPVSGSAGIVGDIEFAADQLYTPSTTVGLQGPVPDILDEDGGQVMDEGSPSLVVLEN